MVQSYPSYPLKWEQCLASNSKAQGGAIWGQAWIQWSLGHVVEVIMVSEGSVRHPWLLWLDGLLPQCWPACCPRHGWDGAEKMLSLLKKRKISKVGHTLHLFPLKIRPLAKSYMPQNFIFLSTCSCLEVSHTGPWTHSCVCTHTHTPSILQNASSTKMSSQIPQARICCFPALFLQVPCWQPSGPGFLIFLPPKDKNTKS